MWTTFHGPDTVSGQNTDGQNTDGQNIDGQNAKEHELDKTEQI